MYQKSLAPIVLFSYKRLDVLKLTLDSLSKNFLASQSDLIIFSDGPRNLEDQAKVSAVRDFLYSIAGFKSIEIHEARVNKGLANSIIDGVTKVLQKHESVIVLEDDLVTSPNFLNYMNDSLIYYRDNLKIFSITGYSVPIRNKSLQDVYFTKRSNSWGWATWTDRWELVDWKVNAFDTFKHDRKLRKRFNRMGSDMSSMLDKQMTGHIDSWAIRWCFHQFLYNLYSVHPFISKIQNVGFTPDASNTREKFNRFKTNLERVEKIEFTFSNDVNMDRKVILQFIKPHTIVSRMKYKVLNLLSRK